MNHFNVASFVKHNKSSDNNNNPLKYTDPSGYYVSGGYGYYDNKLSSYTNKIYQDRLNWNSYTDYLYHRGDYALGGGFGGTTAFFALGSLVLGVGSVEGGLLGDDFAKNPNVDIKNAQGVSIVKHNGSWGFWSTYYYKTGESFPIRNANGMWTLNNQLFTFNILHIFKKYDNETGKYSNKTVESILGLGFSLAGEVLFSKQLGTWMSTSGVLYTNKFFGNQYTSKQIVAKQSSAPLKWIGRGYGFLNAWSISQQRDYGLINSYQFWIEQSSNAFTTFGGIYGTAWGLGWEMGRLITNTNTYQEFKYNFWN